MRTDMQNLGFYIIKSWVFKFLLAYEENSEREISSVGNELVPFMAKNQFKSQLAKYAPIPNKGSIEEKIAAVMNPTQTQLVKDFVKVQIHILPKSSPDHFYFNKIDDIAYFVHANQEALRILKSHPSDCEQHKENSIFQKNLLAAQHAMVIKIHEHATEESKGENEQIVTRYAPGDINDSLITFSDPCTEKDFEEFKKKKIVGSSVSQKLVLKDMSVLIQNSAVGRNVTLGKNVKI